MLLLPVCLAGHSQPVAAQPEGAVITFRFHPGEDGFLLRGNEPELARLHALVDEYRADIANGNLPVCVDGYCASLPTAKENLNTAYVRANRVKSELIARKGLKEADFRTANYACAYGDNKDIVIVTLRIPAKRGQYVKAEAPGITEDSQAERMKAKEAEAREEEAAREEAARKETAKAAVAKDDSAKDETATDEPATAPSFSPKSPMKSAKMATLPAFYRFALRTNLLYDAFLLPTLGVEWRINDRFGIKLDGSLSSWGGNDDKVQKIWLLSPEVRRYLLRDKRFYLGLSANYGEYNLYKYPLGSLLPEDTGYQGTMWGAGLTVGYQLHLSRHFSVDFNLGLGYTHSQYDSFRLTDGVRVYKEKDKTRNFWGPTQAGINLLWTIGRGNGQNK